MGKGYCCDMRGMLSFLILFLLSKKPMCGSELAKEIGKRKGETPSPGTIYPALKALNMRDKTFGWTVEMQIKAARQGLSIEEIPVSYRRRIGTSKVTGTIQGTLKAGWKILFAIFKYRFTGAL